MLVTITAHAWTDILQICTKHTRKKKYASGLWYPFFVKGLFYLKICPAHFVIFGGFQGHFWWKSTPYVAKSFRKSNPPPPPPQPPSPGQLTPTRHTCWRPLTFAIRVRFSGALTLALGSTVRTTVLRRSANADLWGVESWESISQMITTSRLSQVTWRRSAS